ncbi:hypothetical protein BGZ60DRAFT_549870 [Tricladium varicosporioides]|nr:hypothetical protein BGZ60DRAFT_549870 [Hymenoscyphus varicosporioides]
MSPCSNCRMSKVACRFSPKVNEHRQRILISSHYERQVESIEKRLLGIEDSLRTLVLESRKRPAPVDGCDLPTTISKTTQKMPLQPLEGDSHTPDTEANFEGDTSLLAHSLHAKGIFEKLSSRLSSTQSPRLKAALLSLQKTLKSENESGTLNDLRFTSNRKSSPEPSSSELEMPPIQAVLDLLRSSNEQIPRMFVEWPIIEQADFTEKCRDLYFCTTRYSPAHFIIVNAGLYYLFTEMSYTIEGHKAAEYLRCALMCRSNLEQSLEKLSLFVAPSLEACQALLFGAYYALEFAKPSVCLRLTATAAQMSQDLGYHRLPVTVAESPQLRDKKLLFWGIHALDKALSLRLGRTSIIQSCDISTTMPASPSDPQFNPWHTISLCWIEFAKLQGRVFDELFTASALSLPTTTRASRARKLAADLQEWREKYAKVGGKFQHHITMVLDSLDVTCYGVLTIIYRAIPPPDSSQIFCPDCVASARKALEFHQKAVSRFKANDDAWRSYVNWSILYSPFAPFMVVFCEAIATFNLIDLQSLGEFVSSIQPTPDDSEAAVRLYNLCFAFYEVAQVYFTESAASTPAAAFDETSNVYQMPQTLQNLSEHTSNQLRSSRETQPMANNFSSDPTTSFFGQTPDANAHMTWPAEDWFLSDQYMMGILDSSFGTN